MEKTIERSKLELISWLSTIEDRNVINRIIEFRTELDYSMQNYLSEKEIISIEEGIKDAETGNMTDHNEVRKIYEKWL
jgi:hypothetical protein